MTYHDKNDPITPIQSGFSWTVERLNTGRSPKMFRMDAHMFYRLHDLLVSTYGLRSSLHINSVESLAMFLSGATIRDTLIGVLRPLLKTQTPDKDD